MASDHCSLGRLFQSEKLENVNVCHNLETLEYDKNILIQEQDEKDTNLLMDEQLCARYIGIPEIYNAEISTL